MNTTPTPADGKRARWQQLWHRLHGLRIAPLPGEDDVAKVFAGLPARNGGESLPDWLKRLGDSAKPGRYRYLSQFERLAASSAAEVLPLPAAPMTSPDGRFRLSVDDLGGTLRLRLEALAFAAVDYAGQTIALSATADESGLLASIRLDAQGRGAATVADNLQARQALAKPCLLAESADER